MKKYLRAAIVTAGLVAMQPLAFAPEAYSQSASDLQQPVEAALPVSSEGNYEIPGVGGPLNDPAEVVESGEFNTSDEIILSPFDVEYTLPEGYIAPDFCGPYFFLMCARIQG